MPATKMQAAAPPRPVRHVPHLFWGAGFAALSVAILLALGFLIDPARPYAFDAWVLRMLRRPGDENYDGVSRVLGGARKGVGFVPSRDEYQIAGASRGNDSA